MKWLVTVSPDLAAIPISIMLSTSYCWNQQSKLILLKLLKYSLQWCSLSVFSYEKYRILSVSSCQMHKPTATKKNPKNNPPAQKECSSIFTVRTEQFLHCQICFIQTHFSFISSIHCLLRWNFFLLFIMYIYIWITEGEKGISKVDMGKSMVFLLGFCIIFIPTLHNSCLWSRNYLWPLEFWSRKASLTSFSLNGKWEELPIKKKKKKKGKLDFQLDFQQEYFLKITFCVT